MNDRTGKFRAEFTKALGFRHVLSRLVHSDLSVLQIVFGCGLALLFLLLFLFLLLR